MLRIIKAIQTARTHTSGGPHNGAARSDDGRVRIPFSTSGANGSGTRRKQLFAADGSAFVFGAMGKTAIGRQIALSQDLAIGATRPGFGDGGDWLPARMNISLPGTDDAKARAIVNAVHKTCPHAKATRGNVDVTFNLV